MRKALFLLLISLALLTGIGATLSWYGVLTYDSVLEVLTISKNTNHTGTLTVGGEPVLLPADSYTICSVAEIPEEPTEGMVLIVTDGDTACDTTIGGGTERYWMQYSGSAWVCLGGSRTVPPYDATNGETLPISVLRGGTIYNGDATGTEEYTILDVDEELKFFVEARVAQKIELDWAEAWANPYLEGMQVGADNEIDIPAGGKLMIERQYRAGAWVWWCTILAGAVVDGEADD